MRLKLATALVIISTAASAMDLDGTYLCYTPRDMLPYNGDVLMHIEASTNGSLEVTLNDTMRLETMQCNVKLSDVRHVFTYNVKHKRFYRTNVDANGNVEFMEFGSCQRSRT